MAYPNLPHDHGGDVAHVVEHMPGSDSFQIVADVFKLMDDTSRIRIFWLLCHCEECVINISALVDMSSPAVSHHLRQLKNGGLITSQQARLLHHVIEELVEINCPGECALEHHEHE